MDDCVGWRMQEAPVFAQVWGFCVRNLGLSRHGPKPAGAGDAAQRHGDHPACQPPGLHAVVSSRGGWYGAPSVGCHCKRWQCVGPNWWRWLRKLQRLQERADRWVPWTPIPDHPHSNRAYVQCVSVCACMGGLDHRMCICVCVCGRVHAGLSCPPGFTKSLAKEVGSRGVRANVVVPGFIHTDMTKGASCM